MQQEKLTFFLDGSDAIIFNENMLARSLEKVGALSGEPLFERRTPTPREQEATASGQVDLRIRRQLEQPQDV